MCIRDSQKSAPVFAGVFTLVMLSSIGLPGLNGFIGEFLILIGAFVANPWIASVAAIGVIFAAVYLLWAYQRVFHGKPRAEHTEMEELRVGEAMVMMPMVVLIVFLGVYPKPMLERIEPSIEALVAHIDDSVPDWTEPTGEVLIAEEESHDDEGEEKRGAKNDAGPSNSFTIDRD